MALAHEPEYTPTGVLADVCAQVSDLTTVLWASRTGGELVGFVEQVQRLRSVLAAVEAGAVAETDLRGIARTVLHYGSTADWLTHVGGLRRGDGRRVVARAHSLTTTMEHTRDALAHGDVSPEQASVIVTAVDTLPSSPGLRAHGEQVMVDRAKALDATELARTGQHLVNVIDPDREERHLEAQLDRDERAAHTTRTLSIRDDGAGGIWVKGRGSIEDGAVLKAALLPLTCPEPTVDDTGDRGGEVVPDPRDHGTRLWDALMVTAHHGLDTDLPPATHRARPRIAITISKQELLDGLFGDRVESRPHTDDGLELPAGVVRRLACDADLIPVILGTHSEVLDVGRTHRLVTTPLWTALVARDRHCTFPACTRPPLMCHAHHIRHWVDGGTTNLDNLTLLCGHHHRVIHHSPWETRLNPHDKHPEYLPPPKPGRIAEWIRQRPRRE